MRGLSTIALLATGVLGASVAQARTSVLIAASDPAQIVEVEIAKVTAVDSSLWLSVKLGGSASLAVVTSAAQVEPANAADAWLRALDFSTRVRVTPPPGPLVDCGRVSGNVADSGFPELPSLLPSGVSTVTSEVELRRSLADAGLVADPARVAQFSAGVSGPFRFASYRAADGGLTATVRLRDAGPAFDLPGIVVVARDSVPVTVLALATTGVLPATVTVSVPSELAISYQGASARSDYIEARRAWLAEDPTRWLLEAGASSALTSYTVIAGAGEIEPGISHYLDAIPEQRDARACFAAVQAALARGSRQASDFACAAGDDLEHSASELEVGSIRLTRLFGSIGAAGVGLRESDQPEQSPRVDATDFDAQGCASLADMSPAGGSSLPGGASSSPGARSSDGTVVDYSTEPSQTSSDSAGCSVIVSDDSCSGDSSSDASSSDSCSGNGSSDASSSDSCSGNSSSDTNSSDSCSGDSASDGSSSDSCSGDSASDTSSDSSGCGKSNYDGDTCSGSPANSANADSKTSAALEPSRSSSSNARRPKRVRLSLLTLLGALVALPLRRKKAWRQS